MSVPSQRGHIAFALQSAKIGDGAYTPGSYTWQRHKALAASLGMNELVDALPPEVGGNLFVNTTYKNGVFVGGNASLAARLQGSIGHLLYAAAGAKSITASAGVTSYITKFYADPTDESKLPWLTMRRYIPGTTAGVGISEYYVDCRVNTLTMNIPTVGPMSTDFTFLGRKPTNVDGEDASGTTFEDGSSLARSCVGLIELPGFSIATASDGAFTGGQIIISNGMSSPQQEMIIGSYYPDDFIPLTRAAAIRLVYKWKDASLYKKIYNNGTAGDWSPTIQTSSARISVASANAVGSGFTNPYKLQFYAPYVDWSMSAPTLTSGNLLQVEMTGIVKSTISAAPTWEATLWNAVNYASLP